MMTMTAMMPMTKWNIEDDDPALARNPWPKEGGGVQKIVIESSIDSAVLVPAYSLLKHEQLQLAQAFVISLLTWTKAGWYQNMFKVHVFLVILTCYILWGPYHSRSGAYLHSELHILRHSSDLRQFLTEASQLCALKHVATCTRSLGAVRRTSARPTIAPANRSTQNTWFQDTLCVCVLLQRIGT